jgi:ATP-dependent Clp protease ATP-binding subunit ClpA
VYDQFTDRARKVMLLANQEAQRLNHEYIGTEHILLGLVKEGSGIAANVLENLGIDLRKIRLEIEKILRSGPDTIFMGKLSLTRRATKVIEYSIEEARKFQHRGVGTEHLLLGLLREEEAVAAQVLMNLGLTLDAVRSETLNVLGPGVTAIEELQNLQGVPTEIQQELTELDKALAQLDQEKEQAVADGEFEKAAILRERADRLMRRREAVLGVGRKMHKDRELERRIRQLSAQIQQLIGQKEEAVAAHDFDRAIELSQELGRLRSLRKHLIRKCDD